MKNTQNGVVQNRQLFNKTALLSTRLEKLAAQEVGEKQNIK